MGSGLILLVIVGAWLAVLVPMALRSHEATSALGTVDKFHDAMRVLARRDALARIAEAPVVLTAPELPRTSLAERRRRVLLGLVIASAVLLVGAALQSWWLLLPHLLLDVAIACYVVTLRGHAQREAQRRVERREQAAVARAARARAQAPLVPAVAARGSAAALRVRTAQSALAGRASSARSRLDVPAHVAGIPQQMPPRHVLDPSARPLLLVPRPEPARPRGAQGEPWNPVPVPVPTYVTAPRAPRRVVDLTRPGAPATTPEHAPVSKPAAGDADRRRAAGDW